VPAHRHQQCPPPVNFFHLVHPLEAEDDAIRAFDSAINLTLLQPDVIGAAHAVSVLVQLHIRLHLHSQVVVFFRAGSIIAPIAVCYRTTQTV